MSFDPNSSSNAKIGPMTILSGMLLLINRKPAPMLRESLTN